MNGKYLPMPSQLVRRKILVESKSVKCKKGRWVIFQVVYIHILCIFAAWFSDFISLLLKAAHCYGCAEM